MLLSNSFFSAFSFSELSDGLKTKSYVFDPNSPIYMSAVLLKYFIYEFLYQIYILQCP